MDDKGQVQVNRGFRFEFNSAIGPYKGGLRFHPSVNLSILKFLGFEQIFKNSLTTLPMGGGKGGSDFDPKGKSRQRSHALLPELHDRAVPPHRRRHGRAGRRHRRGRPRDRLHVRPVQAPANEFTGVLTGKGLNWGGSLIRPEATGYGAVYFAEEMLKTRGETFKGKVCTVSGSGNVAQYTVEKLNQLGAKVVTLSDSDGTIYDKDGITTEKLAWVLDLKNVKRGRIKEYADKFKGAQYLDGQRPWSVPCDCAFPSATQNEISGEDAKTLLKNGCYVVAEGANMPSTPAAVDAVRREEDPLRPGQGGQRRRRGHLRPGDEPELDALDLDARGSGSPAERHHGRHPQGLLREPPRNTASPATTSWAPTSPASSRSPTRCSTRAWCKSCSKKGGPCAGPPFLYPRFIIGDIRSIRRSHSFGGGESIV